MGKETYLEVARVLLLCATFNIADAAWPAAADSVLVRDAIAVSYEPLASARSIRLAKRQIQIDESSPSKNVSSASTQPLSNGTTSPHPSTQSTNSTQTIVTTLAGANTSSIIPDTKQTSLTTPILQEITPHTTLSAGTTPTAPTTRPDQNMTTVSSTIASALNTTMQTTLNSPTSILAVGTTPSTPKNIVNSTTAATTVVPKTSPIESSSIAARTNATATPLSVTDEYTTTSPLNVTVKEMGIDDRKYYTVEYVADSDRAKRLFIDISNSENSVKPQQLSGHRLALQLRSSWHFQYYGHEVRHFTLTTGGFLYMDRFLHQHLTATQYVAPLMANFHTRTGNDSSGVYYSINDEMFIVQWENLKLADQDDAGAFSFQVQLHKADGTIIFAYRKVPLAVSDISTMRHSVKVGIADAYYYDLGILRTIYEYHNISAEFSRINDDTAVILTHKTTCNMIKDCESCHAANLTDFQCYWCADVNRCSDTKDRGRQYWVYHQCPASEASKESCPAPTTTAKTTTNTSTTRPKASTHAPEVTDKNTGCNPTKDPNCFEDTSFGKISKQKQTASGQKTDTEPGLIIGIVMSVLVVSLISAVILLVIYGYRNPTSPAGQFLIKYRPSELSRRLHGSRGDDYRVSSQTLSNDAYDGEY